MTELDGDKSLFMTLDNLSNCSKVFCVLSFFGSRFMREKEKERERERERERRERDLNAPPKIN